MNKTLKKEQNMEKENEKEIVKIKIFRCIDLILNILIAFGLFTILAFHKIVPFFPILFLFDFCLVVGYPLFLRFVLKKKWFECTKDEYLKVKYILLPYVMMEGIVLLYYHKITFFIIKTILESKGWK